MPGKKSTVFSLNALSLVHARGGIFFGLLLQAVGHILKRRRNFVVSHLRILVSVLISGIIVIGSRCVVVFERVLGGIFPM